MRGFDAHELGYKGTEPSANDAIEEANYMYSKMWREEQNAGREVPVVDLPYEPGTKAGEMYRVSVEAGDAAIRSANTRRFMLSRKARDNWDRIFGKHKARLG